MTSVSVYLVMLVIPLFEAARFRCDYSYIPSKGWFKLHPQPTDHNTAKHICLSEGAELVKPKTEWLKTATISMLNNAAVTAIHIDGVAVRKTNGGAELVKPKTEWLKTASISMLNIAAVTAIHIDNVAVGKTNDVSVLTKRGTVETRPALQKIHFICHKMAGAAEELNDCGTTDSEYSIDIRTGNCYKLHRIRNTWLNAKSICTNEGGNLVVINNETEAQVIKDLFNSNNIDSIPGDIMRNFAFVGLYMQGLDWKTVDGYPLSMYGYNKWAFGTPTNTEGEESCGTVERNGVLYRQLCNETFQFICERKIHDCNEKYTPDSRTGNCYKFHRYRKPYDQSKMACNYEGGNLAVINSETEAQVIRDLFNRNPTHSISGNVRDLAYIGVHKDTLTMDWKTVDGDSLSKSRYNKWAPGEPKLGDAKNCVTVKRNGLLFANQCTLEYPSICEKNIKDCEEYHTFDKSTGNCYKFHRFRHIWSHAFEICTHEGGNLAVINSETEAEVIRDLFNRNPPDSIPGHKFRDSAFLGLKRGEIWQWQTVDGHLLTIQHSTSGYHKWARNQPRNENYDERCVTVDRNGLLSDERCNEEIPFICEKKNEYCL